ncbi:MAG: hypothetical protein AAB657_02705 [Patescibacteria group bacterium]
MASIEELQKQIEEILVRNQRVELDKKWEVSWTRKLIVLILTYFVIVVFFIISKLPEPFLNAVVPSVAFIISTLTVSIIKKWWLKYLNK